MAEEEIYFYEEVQPTCADGDWECMLENFYSGYLLFVEAHVKVGEEVEGNMTIPIIEVNRIDVTGLSNEEINQAIEYVKQIYPDAIAYKLHFCGNHIGRPCNVIDV